MDPGQSKNKSNRIIPIVVVGLVALSTILYLALINALRSYPAIEVSQQNTSPKDNSFTFSAVGDFGANSNTQKVLKQASDKTDFTLALGDFAYDEAANEEQWCDLVHKNVGETYPFMIVPGNHDTEGDSGFGRGHIERYAACLPSRISNVIGSYPGRYYFDYKNLARVIVTSPNLTVNTGEASYATNSANYTWLSQTLDDAKSKNIPWVVLAMHENCITIGVKKCSIGEDIINLAVEKKVDLIFQGHEHGYMRSKQLNLGAECPQITTANPNTKCTTDSEDSYKKGKGSLLVINGTGGYPLREINTSRPESVYFSKWFGSNESPANGPSKVTVTKSKLSVSYASTEGTTKDSFTISR